MMMMMDGWLDDLGDFQCSSMGGEKGRGEKGRGVNDGRLSACLPACLSVCLVSGERRD